MADLLVRLSQEEVAETGEVSMEDYEKTEIEIRIAAEDSAFESGIFNFGALTPYTCPECHGVLSSLKDGDRARFRCHTGHAFSADSLLASVTENIEDSLYSAVRGVEESIMLLNHIGDHYAELNQPKLAAMYFKKAQEAKARAQLVRQAVLSHEDLAACAFHGSSAPGGATFMRRRKSSRPLSSKEISCASASGCVESGTNR
jgi:two-component system chemotaxis response regulator CheB